MKTLLHSGVSRLQTLIYALALSVILPACSDDADRELPEKGKGGTVTLELSLSVPPIVETKAVICEADSGSEARKAGFYYEMQVQTTDTTANNGGHVATKAASSLKNIYAFLFRTDNGAFNGRASIEGSVELTQKLMLAFSGVTDVSSRLVVIANDGTGADYTSSTDFANFSGTYTQFQNLMLTSDITKDEDIPYVGSTTVALDDGMFTALAPVSLYRMLAKITLTNTYAIEDGPSRNSIILYNAGYKYFGTPNNGGDGYNGEGSTTTAAGRYSFFVGKNEDSNTWYVGENVQSDATNAAYIGFASIGEGSNTNPSVGEEYTISGYALRHKVYLNGYALKRNNVYNIKVNMSGSFDFHKNLPNSDPNVSYTELSSVVHGGLNIGMFGGAVGYTEGNSEIPTITGSYTKYLLLQPNTSGSTSTDTETQQWSTTDRMSQPETRRHWDNTYTTSTMKNDANASAYKYCNELSFAVDKSDQGQWYLPTATQLSAIWGILGGIKGNSSYADYSAFAGGYYWSATDRDGSEALYVNLYLGTKSHGYKTGRNRVRCVRDLPSGDLSAQTVITETIDGEDYPVIDLSALQPLGAVLSSEEASARRIQMNQQTPSDDAYLGVGPAVSEERGTWNAKMSSKFQVMRANHSVGKEWWATAYEQCKRYKGEGGSAGQWRLPTQRELSMILILHPQLIGKGGFIPFTADIYNSATEYSANERWYVQFFSGYVDEYTKGFSYYVRCVRDL